MKVIVSEQADEWFNEWQRRKVVYGEKSTITSSAKSLWFQFESETIDTRVTWRDNEAV